MNEDFRQSLDTIRSNPAKRLAWIWTEDRLHTVPFIRIVQYRDGIFRPARRDTHQDVPLTALEAGRETPADERRRRMQAQTEDIARTGIKLLAV